MRQAHVVALLLLSFVFHASSSATAASCKLKLAHKTQPNLPKNVRGVRSELMVRVQVASDGRITSAQVLRGTGSREVDAAVIRAIRDQWRYKPLSGCAAAEEAITIKLEYHDKVGP